MGRIESQKRQVTMTVECMLARTEVRMHLRFSRGQAFLMIITQKLVQEIDRLVRNEPLVLGCNKPRPGFLRITVAWRMRDSHRTDRNIYEAHSLSEDLVVLRVQSDIVLFDIVI